MRRSLVVVSMLAVVVSVQAGELKEDYFAATKQGAWAEYTLDASGGTKATSSSQRNADDDGRVVIEEAMKIKEGPGAGSESKNIYVMPKKFNFARDGLSYGKFTEKMTMNYGSVVMPVDATTLDMIKKSSKDFRGAVTFEAAEEVDGHKCDRYAYKVNIGGSAKMTETGTLWLDATVPFGVVRQVAKSQNADGSGASSFEIKLTNTGAVQIDAPTAAEPVVEKVPAAPVVVSLLDGYKAGRIGIEVSVVAGSAGRQLELRFKNKTDADVTVKLTTGALTIPASEPIDALKIVVKQSVDLVVPAGEVSEAVTVDQKASRGAIEGKFELSVYEGTQLYTGSITLGTISK